jgi:hypothetical protein
MRRRARSSWAWGRPPVRYVSYMYDLPGLLAEVRMQVRPRAGGTNSPRILLVARTESNGLWSARKWCLGVLRALQVSVGNVRRGSYLALQGSDEQSIKDLAGLV